MLKQYTNLQICKSRVVSPVTICDMHPGIKCLMHRHCKFSGYFLHMYNVCVLNPNFPRTLFWYFDLDVTPVCGLRWYFMIGLHPLRGEGLSKPSPEPLLHVTASGINLDADAMGSNFLHVLVFGQIWFQSSRRHPGIYISAIPIPPASPFKPTSALWRQPKSIQSGAKTEKRGLFHESRYSLYFYADDPRYPT